MNEQSNRPNRQGQVQRNGYAAQSANRVQVSSSIQAGGRTPNGSAARQSQARPTQSSSRNIAGGSGQRSQGAQTRNTQVQYANSARRQTSGSGRGGYAGGGNGRGNGGTAGNGAGGGANRGGAYQNSARQSSSRQYAGSSVGNRNTRSSKGGKKTGIIIAAVVAVLLIAAALVYFLIIRPAGNADTADTPVEQTTKTQATVDASTGYHSNKLDGATETVDAYGIVHGTTPSGIKYTVVGRGETTSASGATGKVSLVAGGDVVTANWCLQICDRYAGVEGDGLYDYMPYYQEVAPFIQQYNLRYINQETTMNGPPYSGYPIFNTPDACADAMNQVGFNLVNLATNHAYDKEAEGIESTHAVFDQYPGIVTGGSYLTQEDRDTVHMIERDGVTFAFLAYTGCDNMYGIEPDNPYRPNDYYLAIFDKEKMKKEIANAKKVADVVIVSMHWGEEYTTELSEQQLEYAQFVVDQDVDVVIGSHAHILQPIKMYTSSSGKKIPVVFGLSDFISGWTLVETITSGLFTCDFVYDTSGITVQNCAFYPCIEWSNGGDVYVHMLKNMSDEELAQSTRNDNVDDIVAYVNDLLNSIQFDVPVYR